MSPPPNKIIRYSSTIVSGVNSTFFPSRNYILTSSLDETCQLTPLIELSSELKINDPVCPISSQLPFSTSSFWFSLPLSFGGSMKKPWIGEANAFMNAFLGTRMHSLTVPLPTTNNDDDCRSRKPIRRSGLTVFSKMLYEPFPNKWAIHCTMRSCVRPPYRVPLCLIPPHVLSIVDIYLAQPVIPRSSFYSPRAPKCLFRQD